MTMLGSGCWEGTPAPFCDCKICQAAASSVTSKDNRSRPSFFVEHEETKLLIEMSPDLRLQSSRFKLPPVENYIISHWHFDHLFGFYELHAWIELSLQKKINIFCSEETATFIKKQINFIPANITIVRAFESFAIGSVTLTPIPVYHMNHSDEGKLPTELNNTFGYIVSAGSSKVAYLADYYSVPEESIGLIETCGTVIADGTYLFEEKYPDQKYQRATIEEKDPDHLHGDKILRFSAKFNDSTVIYHSIGHLPNLYHDEMQELLPDGHLIGFDGMEIINER